MRRRIKATTKRLDEKIEALQEKVLVNNQTDIELDQMDSNELVVNILSLTLAILAHGNFEYT